MTDWDNKKHPLVVTLSLSGKTREDALNCKVEDLNQENRMDTLIATLDDLFMKESINNTYEA